MAEPPEILAAITAAYRAGDPEPFLRHMTEDVVLDFSRSRSPYRGIYHGHRGVAELFREARGAWDSVDWDGRVVAELGGGRLVVAGRMAATGRASGIEATGRGAQAWTLREGAVARIELHQGAADALRSVRLERLRAARLYFVCDPAGEAALAPALAGGAEIVQLRDKDPAADDNLVAAAGRFRAAARSAGALFLVNDRPDLAAEAEADGVHVGQEDEPVATARQQGGPGTLVGLSTHSPEQLDAACAAEGDDRPDYISVGPVWETPTKAGREATGLDYVRYAAANATLPWFAIGGIDAGNVGEVVAAGATRIAVVRAIREAPDPEAVARKLVAAVPEAERSDDGRP